MHNAGDKIIIAGGGPSGLMAAIAAATHGAAVSVFEQMARPGLKLLAAGGGKCNLTNMLPAEEFALCFGRQWRFLLPALRILSKDDLLDFFNLRGVSCSAADGFHYFPDSGKSSDILAALLAECTKLGVIIANGSTINELLIKDGAVCGVSVSGNTIACDKVIIACGGKGYPKLGGGESGYELARQAGHKIITPLPGLTGLKTCETWPGECSGISFTTVSAAIVMPGQRNRHERGELLFTHNGVSGPAIINLAGEVSAMLQENKNVTVLINLFAELTAEYWLEQFNLWQRENGRRLIKNWLSSKLPATIATQLCKLAGIESVKAAEFSVEGRKQLAALLTAMPLQISAVEGWDKAMVTRGGVDLKEVNPHTMESKLVRGLYFAGEILDLDGPCGGFNLQWAFSSGNLAGINATILDKV